MQMPIKSETALIEKGGYFVYSSADDLNLKREIK